MTQLTLGILTGEQNVRSPYIRSLLRTGRETGTVVYSFTPRALVEGEARFLEGFGGVAERPKGVFVFPTVVYNRVPTRKEEVSTDVQRIKDILLSRGVPYFNERFFNKREVDIALRKYNDTAALLPATYHGWDTVQATAMVREFGVLFVKPISGSFGEGICQIAQAGTRFRLDVRGTLGTITRFYDELEECLQSCRTHLGGWACIMQEGISLRTYTDAKTDFRMHMHRGEDKHWQAAAIGAKVAHKSAITTHVHSGGRVEVGETVLRAWFGNQAAEARERLVTAAANVCDRLTNELDGNLGELGLDMGIAQDGRIVLFEANSKPGRAIFQHKALQLGGKISRDLVLAHAQALLQEKKLPVNLRTTSEERV